MISVMNCGVECKWRAIDRATKQPFHPCHDKWQGSCSKKSMCFPTTLTAERNLFSITCALNKAPLEKTQIVDKSSLPGGGIKGAP